MISRANEIDDDFLIEQFEGVSFLEFLLQDCDVTARQPVRGSAIRPRAGAELTLERFAESGLGLVADSASNGRQSQIQFIAQFRSRSMRPQASQIAQGSVADNRFESGRKFGA